MPRILVPLADGVEEMEAVIIIDTLRRAELEVVSAGVDGREVVGSRGVGLVADVQWPPEDPGAYDAIVLPGGAGGAKTLAGHPEVLETIRILHAQDRLVAAICAAPTVLDAAGVLDGRRFTCHPSVADDITEARHSSDRVVRDGNILTSQGPGTAIEFALAIIAVLAGAEVARKVAEPMMLHHAVQP